MSTFTCPKCGATIEDSPSGYLTGCEHYPIEETAASVPTPRYDYWKSELKKVGAWDHALIGVPAQSVQKMAEEIGQLERELKSCQKSLIDMHERAENAESELAGLRALLNSAREDLIWCRQRLAMTKAREQRLPPSTQP